MRKHKLLISALCMSMAVAQMPMGVWAATVEESEDITFEAGLTDESLCISNMAMDDTIVADQPTEEPVCETDAVDVCYGETPDFETCDAEHIVVVNMDEVEEYGENSNIYTLTQSDSSTIYRQSQYKLILQAGTKVAVIENGADSVSISFIPKSYRSEHTYKITAYANKSPEQDVSDKVRSNPDGSYSLDIISGQTQINISSEITATSMDIASLFSGGKGTAEEPYLISDYTQLTAIDEIPLKDLYYKLTADIAANDSTPDASSTNKLVPIRGNNLHFDGNGKTISNLCIVPDDYNYLALFGQGKNVAEIKNLNIENVYYYIKNYNPSKSTYAAALASKANSISGCSLKGRVISENVSYLYGLACEISTSGNAEGIFSNNTNESDLGLNSAGDPSRCFDCIGLAGLLNAADESHIECRNNVNNGKIYSSSNGSGLFEYTIGNISIIDCVNNADVVACENGAGITDSLGRYYNESFTGVIKGCINNGNIVVDGENCGSWSPSAGGIASAGGGGEIVDCINNGNVTLTGEPGHGIEYLDAAGIIPETGSDNRVVQIKNCANLGTISAYNAFGITRRVYNNASVINCYNAGDIIIIGENHREFAFNVAGLVGEIDNNGLVKNCFNSGCIDVSSCVLDAQDKSVIAGISQEVNTSKTVNMENCYNVGTFKTDTIPAFAITGGDTWLNDVSSNVKNCYYLKSGDIKGVRVKEGISVPTSTARGLTGTSMTVQASYKNWDFTNTWQIGVNDDYPYPELKDNPYKGRKVEVDQTPGKDDPESGKPSKPDPTPEEPVPTIDGGIFVVNQKFDVTGTDFFGQTYAKYDAVPKGSAKVTKAGLVTVSKVPADGKITINGYVKEGSKFKKDKAYVFTVKKPVVTKTISFTMPYDKDINPDDTNASKLADSLISGADGLTYKWVSNKPAIADYDEESGKIIAKSKGTAKLSAVFGDPDSPYSAKYPVTVKVSIPKINKTKADILSGATPLTLKISGAPKGSVIAWSVAEEDAEFVSVDAQKGKVTALKYKEGDAEGTDGKVTVKASIDGKEFDCYTCEVTVKKPMLAKTIPAMKVGKNAKITVKNTKYKAKEGGGITFESDNPEIATVDAKGSVKAVSSGECIIKVTVAGVELECPIKVN